MTSCCPPYFDPPLHVSCVGVDVDVVLSCMFCVEGHGGDAVLSWSACVGTGGAWRTDQCTVHRQLFVM